MQGKQKLMNMRVAKFTERDQFSSEFYEARKIDINTNLEFALLKHVGDDDAPPSKHEIERT